MKKLIIFTDLDGTLLDASTYSFEAANNALHLIRIHSIPLVICSSKTRAEIEYYRRLLGNHDPFISENGGGVFIPADHKALIRHFKKQSVKQRGGYFLFPLGAHYEELRKAIIQLRSSGFNIKGFGDMDVGEIAELTGLTLKEAAMARERDFDEPFLLNDKESRISDLVRAVKELGFNITRGRFYHLLGNSDKGKAVSFLLDLYKRRFDNLYSVAIGDSLNDLPMLEKVDLPLVVQKKNGTYDPGLHVHSAIWWDGVGPEGWGQAVVKIISETLRD